MEQLTDKQQQVLQIIIRFIEREERPPTTREIAVELGCHIKTVYQYILVLERKGAITRRKWRVHVARELRHDRGVPIIGHIAAGEPLFAEQHIEGILSLDEMFQRNRQLFALKVHGDSMIGAQICDGDHVIVREQPRIENGEIGVVLIGDEATVKRIYFLGRRICLIPENSAFTTVEYDLKTNDVRVLGKVVGVVRRLE